MRILGIDYGDARVGLALSDPTGLLAGGIGTLHIRGMNDAVNQIAAVIAEKNVTTAVIGLPLNMDGSHGASAEKIKAFGEKLLAACPELTIIYHDERRTTMLAAQYMSETGTFGKKRKESVDTLSAQIILQTYLDRQRAASSEESP